MSLIPLGDRLIVRAEPSEQVTVSGLVIPDTAQEKPQKGTVLAVGNGAVGDKGVRVPLSVEPGVTVLYSRYGGTEVRVDGEDLLVVRESDVLAIVAD